MTGTSPSRVLKRLSASRQRWNRGESGVSCHKSDLNHQLFYWQVTVVCLGRICSIRLHWILHFSPPSCSSYMMVFSHHTQSLSGGVCTWLYDNLSISGGNEEAFSSMFKSITFIRTKAMIVKSRTFFSASDYLNDQTDFLVKKNW